MATGSQVYFADRNALKGSLGYTLIKIKPTWLFGVPRIFEKIQEQQMQVEAKDMGLKKQITKLARAIMLQHNLHKMKGYKYEAYQKKNNITFPYS